MNVVRKLEVDEASMSLDELLTEIHTRRLILTVAGVLWSPHTHVPMKIRRAVKYYRSALIRLLYLGDFRLCASKHLHRPFWRHRGAGEFECTVCRDIAV